MLFTFKYSRKELRYYPLLPTLLGMNHRQEPILRPGGMPFYQWFYCAKGEGDIQIEQQKSHIAEGQGMLIFPNAAHIYKGISPDWQLHILGFHGSICPILLNQLQMQRSGVYHFSDTGIFPRHIQQIYHLNQRELPEKASQLSKACYDFLLDLAPCISRIGMSPYDKTDSILHGVVTYLEEHYDSPISLSQLAQSVGLSKEYLCTYFKRNMKQTILQYLLSLRIARARIFLIQYPEKKAYEIGAMCGFESPSYFGKVFKKEMGVTPEEYRHGKI